uniref:Heat shock 70 kDa protein 12B n=1 Tax=Magallana gigas TaxID=29159 RepID=K1PES2_MAGGI
MAHVIKVVAALDLGGTYVGYGYKIMRDHAKEVQFPEWGPHHASKTKSCVLLTPTRHFHSLGDEAEQKFAELRKTGESPGWFYCQNIKRMLMDKQDYVKCHNKQTVPVMDMLTAVLRFFSSHLLARCGEGAEEETLTPSNVRWVINLPMKARDDIVTVLSSAAIKAGLDSRSLSFIPEVESMLTSAKALPKSKPVTGSEQTLCICDIGGSSVRVAKLEMDGTDGSVTNVDLEYSVEVGGHLMDERFLKFLRNVIGAYIVQAFEDFLPVPMLEFMNLFELNKTNMAPEFSKKYIFAIPHALMKKFKFLVPSFRGKDVFSPSPRYGEKVTMTENSLVADESVVWFFLKEAVDKVLEFLQSSFEKLRVSEDTTVILTGGHSQYWKLRDVMRQRFTRRQVIYMDAPSESALIGAIMVAKEIEAKHIFESLPIEIQRMSSEEREVFFAALQRGQFAENDVTINVIAGLDNSYTTFILPVPYNWKSLYIHGKDILNNDHDTRKSASCPNRNNGTLPAFVLSKENIQCTPDLIFFADETPEYETTPTPRDLGTTPTPRDLGVRHNQNVDQLHSVHIRELGSESDVFQGRQSLLDWRPVYVLLYSLNQIITDSVRDSESGPGSRQTSLLDFLTTWVKMIFTFTKTTDRGHPHIVLFGTHHQEQKETFVRSRSDIVIKQLDKYFSGSPVRQWLVLDPLLRGNVENERDLGLERLRQTIMDIANKHKGSEWFPRHWVSFYDRLMSRKREGHKVISSNVFRKYNTVHSESLEKQQELEVFLKYHVSIGNFLDFSHVDHNNYIFLDPCVIGDELNVLYNLEKNEKQSKSSPYKEAVIQKSTLLQYLALDRVKGQGQVILGTLLDLGLLVKPMLYDSHGNLIDPTYLIMPALLPVHSTSSLREKLFAEKKCITMRFHGHGYFPLSIFQRLLSSVVSIWSVVNFSGKPLLAADVGAFSLDSFHRLVLACHEECIDVYIYHKSGSVYVNPTTETEFQVNDAIFVTEVATCNCFSSCYASVDQLQKEDNWKCEKHGVGGRSRDLLGVWYPVEETFPDPVHEGQCQSNCRGLREYLLSKSPSEQLVGRLARRLDPQVIPTIAQKLGLTQIEVRRVRDSAARSTAEPTAGSTAWRQSFQTLQNAVRKHSLTLGDLQEAIVSAGVGKHVMCQTDALIPEKNPNFYLILSFLSLFPNQYSTSSMNPTAAESVRDNFDRQRPSSGEFSGIARFG